MFMKMHKNFIYFERCSADMAFIAQQSQVYAHKTVFCYLL